MFENSHHFEINDGQFTNFQGSQNNYYSDHPGPNPDIPQPPSAYSKGMTQCPTSVPTFTGRKEALETLKKFFLEEETISSHPGGFEDEDESNSQQGSMKIFLLYGLGGAGKTQLALEFKKRFKKKFTRIFYIYANTVEYIQGSYWDIATAMESKVVQNWQIGLHLLEATEENWLLIINNADDPGLSLDTYIPSCDHGNIIITSRNPALQSLADDSLELQDMTSDEGTQLLIKHAFDRRKQVIELEEKEKAAEIAKELYYFPLALTAQSEKRVAGEKYYSVKR
ncbi:P-loop containing nucleoside triphosphate hydrolase protein [Lentinula raphanica]|uniref:P-loop containing nucleoside triphosphate hydrolase protein n=1 Tax=Lentinula raphanica TaxID=153919 RepID=A0AA38U9E4_9AGAR|nr:P-loop containing nucleoside triphosphate hydrolase protein [Lentinula raphanica]